VAALFISGLGLATGYGWLLAMVALGGAGIASFHPQGASNAVAGVKVNRGRAMSIFICSGSLGMALGPAYFSAMAGAVGLAGMHWAAVPGLLVTVVMVALLPQPVERAHGPRKGFDWAPLRAVWKPLTILFFLVFIRSVVQITFAQFLPLFLHKVRGYSVSGAALSLTLYLVGGTIGGLAGGNLADRFGGRRVIIFSMAGATPFLALFLFTGGPLSEAALFVSGLMLLFTIPVNVVMAQELAPTQGATVSALMMGFAWGSAGMIFIPLVGWLSDIFTMQTVFSALVFCPVLGFLLALRLPK
jgi:FSR family fosmidomycin resistance protein-like MFS transporter